MSFKYRWTISSCYDHPGAPAAFWKKILFPDFSTVVWSAPSLSIGAHRPVIGAPRLIVSTPRPDVGVPRMIVCAPKLVFSAPRCNLTHPKFSPALRDVPTLITITPMLLLYQSSEIPVTSNVSPNALLESDTHPKLTHISLHSTSSQSLQEALRD